MPHFVLHVSATSPILVSKSFPLKFDSSSSTSIRYSSSDLQLESEVYILDLRQTLAPCNLLFLLLVLGILNYLSSSCKRDYLKGEKHAYYPCSCLYYGFSRKDFQKSIEDLCSDLEKMRIEFVISFYLCEQIFT